MSCLPSLPPTHSPPPAPRVQLLQHRTTWGPTPYPQSPRPLPPHYQPIFVSHLLQFRAHALTLFRFRGYALRYAITPAHPRVSSPAPPRPLVFPGLSTRCDLMRVTPASPSPPPTHLPPHPRVQLLQHRVQVLRVHQHTERSDHRLAAGLAGLEAADLRQAGTAVAVAPPSTHLGAAFTPVSCAGLKCIVAAAPGR